LEDRHVAILSDVVETVRQAIESHWRRIFNFAFRMTLDRKIAREVVTETYLRAYVGADKMPAASAVESWLIRIAAHVTEKRVGDNQDVSFDMLDDTLRSEATRTGEVRSLSDPQKNFMLWELKQGCMTSVVNCLSGGERVAFVLSTILGMAEDDAARTLGITPSAFKVRLSRARKKVTDYLAPRCEHVDPRNPCHCPSRLGVAMSKGFLPPPPNALAQLRQPYGRFGSSVDGEDAPLRDVMAIYQSLPEPDPPEELVKDLLAKLESGEWAEVKKKGKH
jgi:RNA polymerase sigma factor (sigma-70 family)